MAYEAAKCPSCGASIQVPTDSEQAHCMHCGSILIVKDAIQKLKIEVSGKVSLSGLSSVENDIELGKQCIEAKDWQSAYNVFCKAVDKQANNYDAWMGCLAAMTQNFSWVDRQWVRLDGIKGVESSIKNCSKYATPEQHVFLTNQIRNLLDSQERKDSKEINTEIRKKKARVTFLIIGLILIFIGIMSKGLACLLLILYGLTCLISAGISCLFINNSQRIFLQQLNKVISGCL